MAVQIQLSSRVCRKAVRDSKIVGTVISVGPRYARVKWDKSLQGFVRLGSGESQSSRIRLSALCAESEWERRIIEKPDDTAYVPQHINVMVEDGSGVWNNGVNFWQFASHQQREALSLAIELATEGKRVKVQQREEAKTIPAGCQKPRMFSRWVTLFQA